MFSAFQTIGFRILEYSRDFSISFEFSKFKLLVSRLVDFLLLFDGMMHTTNKYIQCFKYALETTSNLSYKTYVNADKGHPTKNT